MTEKSAIQEIDEAQRYLNRVWVYASGKKPINPAPWPTWDLDLSSAAKSYDDDSPEDKPTRDTATPEITPFRQLITQHTHTFFNTYSKPAWAEDNQSWRDFIKPFAGDGQDSLFNSLRQTGGRLVFLIGIAIATVATLVTAISSLATIIVSQCIAACHGHKVMDSGQTPSETNDDEPHAQYKTQATRPNPLTSLMLFCGLLGYTILSACSFVYQVTITLSRTMASGVSCLYNKCTNKPKPNLWTSTDLATDSPGPGPGPG